MDGCPNMYTLKLETSGNSKAKSSEADALFYYAIPIWCGKDGTVEVIVALS